MYTHTGDWPHVCPQCGKGFTCLSELQAHEFTHDVNFKKVIKKHICVQCHKVFEQAADLRYHMYTHTGEWPHVCSHCGKRFSNISHLSTHKCTQPVSFDIDCQKPQQHWPAVINERNNRTPSDPKAETEVTNDTASNERNYRVPKNPNAGKKVTNNNKCTQPVSFDNDCQKSQEHRPSVINERNNRTPRDPKAETEVTNDAASNKRNYRMPKNPNAAKKVTNENTGPVCPHCNEVFREARCLENHMDICHHVCTKCTKGFLLASNLKAHMDCHKKRKIILKCPECARKFDTCTGLENHLLSHSDCTYAKGIGSYTSGSKNPYGCHKCKKEFSCFSLLKRHSIIHINQRFYVCPSCGKEFRKEQFFRQHICNHTAKKQEVSSGKKTRGKRASRKRTNATQKAAQSQLHPAKEKTSCPYCNVGLRNLLALRMHLASHGISPGERPLSCPYCNKRFKTPKLLKFHKYIHTGGWPHTCDQCGEGFSDPSFLKKHMSTHTGWPHMCPRCGSGFTQQRYLDHHVSAFHSSSLVCEFCNKRFISLSLLKCHIHTHHKEAVNLEEQVVAEDEGQKNDVFPSFIKEQEISIQSEADPCEADVCRCDDSIS